jgi:hypothetical protein
MPDIVVEEAVTIYARATNREPSRLLSLSGATLSAPLIVEGNISLADCLMDRATGMDQLKIDVTDPRWNGLTAWGVLFVLLLRLAAPAFLALAVLAVRARVQR